MSASTCSAGRPLAWATRFTKRSSSTRCCSAQAVSWLALPLTATSGSQRWNWACGAVTLRTPAATTPTAAPSTRPRQITFTGTPSRSIVSINDMAECSGPPLDPT